MRYKVFFTNNEVHGHQYFNTREEALEKVAELKKNRFYAQVIEELPFPPGLAE